MLTIRIPRYLPSFAMSNPRMQKALSIYLYIKAINDSGYLVWNTAMNEAAAGVLNMTPRNVHNWLKRAYEFELITKVGKNGLMPVSWDNMLAKCGIAKSGYYKVLVKDCIDLPLVIELKAMIEAQKRCERAMLYKINNPICKDDTERVLQNLSFKFPIDPKQKYSAIAKCQRYDFLTANSHLTDLERFHIFIANPDTNIGIERYSQLFGYANSSGFVYLKKKLAAAGMIDIEKRQLKVPANYFKQMTTVQSRETKIGNVAYFRTVGSLILTLADKITFTPQSAWKTL